MVRWPWRCLSAFGQNFGSIFLGGWRPSPAAHVSVPHPTTPRWIIHLLFLINFFSPTHRLPLFPSLPLSPSANSVSFCLSESPSDLPYLMASPQSSPQQNSSSPLPLAIHPPPSSRRLPPPCWSHDETIALIDAYREKWYSLRRGNLKAADWQDVADAVCQRCPLASPPKTAVQCRHKMEKLRKRYRTELQRAKSIPSARFCSSWVHFKRMDSMEKGPKAEDSGSDDNDMENENDGEDEEEDDDGNNMYLYSGNARRGQMGNGVGSGFRIRIPSGVSIAKPGMGFRGKNHGNLDQKNGGNGGISMGETRVLRDCSWAKPVMGKRSGGGSGKGGEVVADMVSAIKVLGDGFVKMEQMKMEMVKEMEAMRMEMEMKRTEMILESQQRMVEAFAQAVSENKSKKAKRMSLSDS